VGSQIEIQSIKKRGYLRQLCLGAKATSSTLFDTLVAAQSAVWQSSFKVGRIIISQSGSGQSGSFQMNGGGNDWTQDNIFGMVEEFLQLLATIDATVYPDDGSNASTDALFAQMCADDSLAGITSQLGDWTGLNIPSIGGIPSA
jgi:hypothetical protein